MASFQIDIPLRQSPGVLCCKAPPLEPWKNHHPLKISLSENTPQPQYEICCHASRVSYVNHLDAPPLRNFQHHCLNDNFRFLREAKSQRHQNNQIKVVLYSEFLDFVFYTA